MAMDSYDVRKAFERIELELIHSMARNVGRHLDEEKKMGFNWNQWQAEQIKAFKRYQKKNEKIYGPEFKKINKAIEEMLHSNALNAAQEEHMRFLLNDLKGGKLDAEGDFFHLNSPKLDALINATTSDFEKAEYAMLRKANDEYRKTIFDAQVYANTGAGTLKQAVDMATRDFLQKGINCVEYADGKKVNIASYAEMAIRTANTRAVNIAEGEVRKDRKWHLVRISEYGQCSKVCLPWQGRIYVDDVYSGGTAEESKEKSYPLLSEAIDGGLFHPNCKHRSTTYFPELEEDENEVEEFENHPLQKDFNVNHRDLQKQKRLEAGSLDETNKKKAKAKRVKAEKKEKTLKKKMEKRNDEIRFTPAKTISEAEDFAKSFGIDADYSGYDISVANAINETIQKVTDEFGKGALSSLKAIRKDVKKGREGGFDSFSGTLSLSGTKGKNSLFKMGERTRKANKRYENYGFKYFSADSDLHTIHHEFGHVIHSSLGGSVDVAATPLDKDIISFMRGKNEKRLAEISYYATTDNHELVAECVAKYFDGSSSEISSGIIEILKKYARQKHPK